MFQSACHRSRNPLAWESGKVLEVRMRNGLKISVQHSFNLSDSCGILASLQSEGAPHDTTAQSGQWTFRWHRVALSDLRIVGTQTVRIL
eukprot:1432829-Amphidinium_carterae.1